MQKVWVLHGPNLNLLGIREQSHYGQTTLAEIDEQLQILANDQAIDLRCFQHNSEAKLIDCVHSALSKNVDYFIINPAAFTHTSIALRDALLAVNIPFIEVHLSNIAARESFRQISYFSDIARGTITGFGAHSYTLALQAIIQILKLQRKY